MSGVLGAGRASRRGSGGVCCGSNREREGLVVIWFTEPLVLFVCWSDIMCGPTRYTPPPALLSFGS